jgi:hypothetical protein
MPLLGFRLLIAREFKVVQNHSKRPFFSLFRLNSLDFPQICTQKNPHFAVFLRNSTATPSKTPSALHQNPAFSSKNSVLVQIIRHFAALGG